jgi:hypothetical protein
MIVQRYGLYSHDQGGLANSDGQLRVDTPQIKLHPLADDPAVHNLNNTDEPETPARR